MTPPTPSTSSVAPIRARATSRPALEIGGGHGPAGLFGGGSTDGVVRCVLIPVYQEQ
jgi:hypothetical protein